MTPEQLVEIETIKRLKYHYMRCLDQKLWDEIAELFTDDATAAYSGGKYSYTGRDAIVGFLKKGMGSETFLSSHRAHHPEIDVSGDTAVGVWAFEDVVIETRFQVTIRGAGFYRDEYRKLEGRWKIQHTGYRRTFEEVQARGDVPGLELTASWWGSDGQSNLDA